MNRQRFLRPIVVSIFTIALSPRKIMQIMGKTMLNYLFVLQPETQTF